MTDDMLNLRGLLKKSPDADLLREMIGLAAQRLTELEVGGLTGAGFGERILGRLAQRAGYRDEAAASQEWRRVADQLRPTVPKLAALMDPAETGVLA